MPVVGRGDGNGIEIFVFECLADVGETFGFRSTFRYFLDLSQPFVEHVAVDIDEVGNFDVRLIQPTLDVRFAATVCADNRDSQPVVCPFDISRGASSGNQQRSPNRSGTLKKLTTRNVRHLKLPRLMKQEGW